MKPFIPVAIALFFISTMFVLWHERANANSSSAVSSIHAQAKLKDSANFDLGKEVARIMGRVAKTPGSDRDRMWLYSIELRELAGENDENLGSVMSLLTPFLDSENSQERVIAAHVMLSTDSGDPVSAVEVLTELVENSDDEELVACAASMIARYGPEEAGEALEAIQDRIEASSKLSARSKVELARAEAMLGESSKSEERLKEFASSSVPELRSRAALALAELGNSEETSPRLKALTRESGELSHLAKVVLDNIEIVDEIDRPTGDTSADKKHIVTNTINALAKNTDAASYEYGIESLPVTTDNLLLNACRGMVSSLDSYSEFMTNEEQEKRREDNSGEFYGIGARVNKSRWDPSVRVAQPMYGGPAYDAGIRSGDYLWEVEFLETKERVSLVGMEIPEVVKLLRGPKDTKIRLYVKRRGEADLVPLDITRGVVHSDTSVADVLPGGLGYVKLTQFGGKTHEDLEHDLRALGEKGANGLILDLRGNPGGFLTIVLYIANLFTKRGAPIARTEGIFKDYGEKQIFRNRFNLNGRVPLAGSSKDNPVVVLIDESSASGSELLSGALKDHNRATIIGQNSFGKGVGQSTYPICWDEDRGYYDPARAPNRDSAAFWLKCTVFNYYILPSGTSVTRVNGKGGVTPDIKVPFDTITSWEAYKLNDLRRSFVIDDWVRNNWAEHGETFERLAEFDGYDESQYPGFDEFYKSLNTELSRETIRREIQNEIRVRTADIKAREFPQNYQRDKQLQRAIIELCKDLKIEPESIPNYKPFLKDHQLK